MSDELMTETKAIVLRGLLAAAGVVRVKLRAEFPSDDFDASWLNLPPEVRAVYLRVAQLLEAGEATVSRFSEAELEDARAEHAAAALDLVPHSATGILLLFPLNNRPPK